MQAMLGVVLLMCLVAAPSGLALRCYTCSAQTEPRDSWSECENFYPNSDESHKSMICDFPDAVCSKHVTSSGGTKWVHRGCQSSDFCSVVHFRPQMSSELLLECSVCRDRDLCNDSSTLRFNFGVVLFIIIMQLTLIL